MFVLGTSIMFFPMFGPCIRRIQPSFLAVLQILLLYSYIETPFTYFVVLEKPHSLATSGSRLLED